MTIHENQTTISMIVIMTIFIMIILAPISVEVSKGGKGKAKAAFGDPPVSYVPSPELVLKISYNHTT